MSGRSRRIRNLLRLRVSGLPVDARCAPESGKPHAAGEWHQVKCSAQRSFRCNSAASAHRIWQRAENQRLSSLCPATLPSSFTAYPAYAPATPRKPPLPTVFTSPSFLSSPDSPHISHTLGKLRHSHYSHYRGPLCRLSLRVHCESHPKGVPDGDSSSQTASPHGYHFPSPCPTLPHLLYPGRAVSSGHSHCRRPLSQLPSSRPPPATFEGRSGQRPALSRLIPPLTSPHPFVSPLLIPCRPGRAALLSFPVLEGRSPVLTPRVRDTPRAQHLPFHACFPAERLPHGLHYSFPFFPPDGHGRVSHALGELCLFTIRILRFVSSRPKSPAPAPTRTVGDPLTRRNINDHHHTGADCPDTSH